MTVLCGQTNMTNLIWVPFAGQVALETLSKTKKTMSVEIVPRVYRQRLIIPPKHTQSSESGRDGTQSNFSYGSSGLRSRPRSRGTGTK